MRPGFTFMVTFILVIALVVGLCIINFVLLNRQMFETVFDITFAFPFFGWSYTLEGVQFMYIIAGGILLGALILAITTLGLDTKRALKLRSMRKELKKLQEALQNAQAQLAQYPEEPREEEQPPVVEEEAAAFADSSATPEEITKSFEDAIQKTDFLEQTQERLERDQTDEMTTETDVQAKEARDEATVVEGEPTEEEAGPSMPDEKMESGEETPIEAELVEREEFPEEPAMAEEPLDQEEQAEPVEGEPEKRKER